MTRRLISLFLCAALATGSVSILAACSDKKKDGPSGDGEVTSSPSAKVPLEVNFSDLSDDEKTINIAYVEGGNFTLTEHSLVLDPETINSTDQVQLAVQERNQMVESQLGVKLNAIKVSDDFGALAEMTKDSIMARYGDYDILAGYQYYSIGMATMEGGLLLNLADMASLDADYIDLAAPYWGNNYNDALSYKGAYYWVTGDLALRYLGGMYCTFVNSRTYADKLQTTYGNIYDIARDNKWTLDLMMTMSELCYTDANGDSKYDVGDKYGFGYELQDPIDGIAFASGVTFSQRDPSTGDIYLTFNNQHSTDFADKLYKLLNAAASYEYASTDSETVMTNFAQGNVAFTVNKIFMSQVYLEEFNDFYVIPAPKYDEAQANYLTGIHDGVTIFAIPEDCKKVPQTVAALELMAAYSTMFVKPAYYDAALKNRYVRDEAAAEMIDLIHSTVHTDFIAAWSNTIGDIVHNYRTKSRFKIDTIIRELDTWQTSLADLTAALDEARYNA